MDATSLLLGLGLFFLFEGLLYLGAPKAVKQLAQRVAEEVPVEQLRQIGGVVVLIGLSLIVIASRWG